ncbi:MAG: nicotinate-nicotinamide nucleotide adenylyltransferase [Fibrobacteria bacterium]|nr:nicotinate-nicotinamide nucleotide adenylyltransferase [Fibrobacteria bacterium]
MAGNKKQIAVFGGVFDPPHRGHQDVINWVVEHTPCEEVIVLPCGVHRLKRDICTPATLRLEMARLAFGKIRAVRISDLDMEISARCPSNKGCPDQETGSTWSLLNLLQKQLTDEVELFFVLGADNAETIHSWYRWEDLIKTYRFITLPRDGIAPKGKWYTAPPHIYASEFLERNISSTKLRKGKKTGWLDKRVSQFIREHGLYNSIVLL